MKPGDRVTIEAVIVGVHMDAPEQFITSSGTVFDRPAADWSRLEVAISRVVVPETREVRTPRGIRVHEIDLVS